MMAKAENSKIAPLRPRVKCPECGRDSSRPHYPFCSARCKDIDLNRWLSGAYAIPGRPVDDQDGDD